MQDPVAIFVYILFSYEIFLPRPWSCDKRSTKLLIFKDPEQVATVNRDFQHSYNLFMTIFLKAVFQYTGTVYILISKHHSDFFLAA